MTRILHLSDLHFGRADTTLEAPLLTAIAGVEPSLVVISGDFTQRARHRQFYQARAFLDRIAAPILAVPGNHDTPLDNLFVRFFRPYGRYRRYIHPELEPVHEDADAVVVGVNSVNRFAWQRGRVPRRRLTRLQARLGADRGRLRVAVLHHPLEHGPDVAKRLTRGADRTLDGLVASGADLVLSGHLHTAIAAPFRAAPGLLFVQAGTGLSTRLRGGEGNSFNVIDHDNGRLEITTWSAGPGPRFDPKDCTAWRRDANGHWQPDPA